MKTIRIGTHDGLFHLDEVIGVLVLKLVYVARGFNVEIVRSRDSGVLATCDFLVDVGRIYDYLRGRFDHHQGGAGERSNGIAYASAGLVWKHYGAELAGSMEVAELVDQILMVHVDYRDCKGPQGRDLHIVEIADALTILMPTWDEDGRDDDIAFMEALGIMETLLARYIRRAQSLIKAPPVVREAIASAEDPQIIILEQGCPWHDVVHTEAPDALFVVIGEKKGREWRVECIPSDGKSGAPRAPFPAQCVTQKNGSVCFVSSRDDALKIAQTAIAHHALTR